MNDLRVEGGDDELSRVARVIGLLGQHLGYCCPILHDTPCEQKMTIVSALS